MHHNKLIVLSILFSILICSCIEEYNPHIGKEDAIKYVIYGKIANNDNKQYVYISKSAEVGISNLKKFPVSNCDVKIIDDKGNTFQLIESEEQGCYCISIDSQYLTLGSLFQINVVTPEGDLIVSEFEQLYESPDVDSIYYEISEVSTTDPEINIPTLQFYMDYNGENANSQSIRIEFEETWEYHADFPIKWYYDGWNGIVELPQPDYSKQICWKTTKSSNIYILSTEDLTGNNYKKYPLHSIPNTSENLAYGYSLLIKQSAISKQAYEYFEKLNANIVKEGGLYDTQPQQIEGNLTNINNPDKKVLGYFYTSGVKEKRIFISPISEFHLNFSTHCEPIYLQRGPGMLRNKFAYLWYFDDEPGKAYQLQDACVDCTSLGGVTTKPDFWPWF